MELEMRTTAQTVPDLYGLPEYKISEVITEIDGPDIRVACGIRKFGQVQWLYTVVINAEVFLRLNYETRRTAEEAVNIQQLMSRAH